MVIVRPNPKKHSGRRLQTGVVGHSMVPVAAVLLGTLAVFLMIGSVGQQGTTSLDESTIHAVVGDIVKDMDHMQLRYRVKRIDNLSNLKRQSIPFRWRLDDGTYESSEVIDGVAVSDDYGYSVPSEQLRDDLVMHESQIRTIVDSAMASYGFVPDSANINTLYSVVGYTRAGAHCVYNLHANGDSPYVLACPVLPGQ